MHRRALKLLSIVSGVIAVITLIAGIPAVFTVDNWVVYFAIFRMLPRSSGFFSAVGNTVCVLLLAYCFAAMCCRGLLVARGSDTETVQSALIAGIAVLILMILSLLCSIYLGILGFDDMLLLAIPVIYVLYMIKELNNSQHLSK